MHAATCVVGLAVACGPTDTEEYDAQVRALAESERAFARAAGEVGIRDAFLAFLSEDAVIFRPGPVAAGPYLRGTPAQPGLLSWEPAFADLAQAGDLGFTTGPWAFRTDPAGEPLAHGQYFSFWKQQSDGSWKVVIDHGTTNPPPAVETVEAVETPGHSDRGRRRDVDPATELERLLERDRAFAAATAVQGKLQALNAFMTGDVRLLRNGQQPTAGIEAARSHAVERTGAISWRVIGGDVASSGDLGYTYGEYEQTVSGSDTPAERGYYVRAWRPADGTWRVYVDLMSSLPPSGG